MRKDANLDVAIQTPDKAKAPSKTEILRAGAILIHKKLTKELEEETLRKKNLEGLFHSKLEKLFSQVPGFKKASKNFISWDKNSIQFEVTIQLSADLLEMYRDLSSIDLRRVAPVDDIFKDLQAAAKDKACNEILNNKVLSSQILEASETLLGN